MISHNHREIRWQGPWDQAHIEQVYAAGATVHHRNLAVYGERAKMLPRSDGETVDEFRHLYYYQACTGKLENLHGEDAYGDGMVLSAKHPHPDHPVGDRCYHMSIRGLHLENCRRNNLALIGVEYSTFEDFYLARSWGNPGGPCAGIDFEPDGTDHTNRFLYFKNGRILDNQNWGILSENELTHNVMFDNVTISAARSGWAGRGLFGKGQPWNKFGGIYDGYSAVFRNCKFYGPLSTFKHSLFIDCLFVADPDNYQCPWFAIDMYEPENVKLVRPRFHRGEAGDYRFVGGTATIEN